MSNVELFRLQLFGPFCLNAAGGKRVVITSKKSRALLALLALSPSGERTRGWLQQMLWSRCDRSEAQSSLRRELSNLRKIIAVHGAQLIESDSTCVRLRTENCVVVEQAPTPGPDRSQLLEGLDLKGEEPFEEWLREHRVSDRCIPLRQIETSLVKAAPDRRLAIGLMPVIVDPADKAGCLSGEHVVDQIAAALIQSGLVGVVDYRTSPDPNGGGERSRISPDVLLGLRVLGDHDCLTFSVMVSQAGSNALMYARRLDTSRPSGSFTSAERLRLSVFVHEVADQMLYALAYSEAWRQEPRHLVGKLVSQAIRQMFSLSQADVDDSANLLESACGIANHSTIFAWRAYRSVFRMDGPSSGDRKLLSEEAEEFSRRSLALDPYNGLSLGLIAHVNAFVFRQFDRAADCLDRAKALGADHVMFYDSCALFHFYTGNYCEARRVAQIAEMLGRHLPYRYCFATSLCMIEALSGDLTAAVSYGERALALEPRLTKRPYAPTLRYLGASYSALGRLREAELTLSQLKLLDPNLSSATIDVTNYPTPSDNAAAFVRRGLLAVAM